MYCTSVIEYHFAKVSSWQLHSLTVSFSLLCLFYNCIYDSRITEPACATSRWLFSTKSVWKVFCKQVVQITLISLDLTFIIHVQPLIWFFQGFFSFWKSLSKKRRWTVLPDFIRNNKIRDSICKLWLRILENRAGISVSIYCTCTIKLAVCWESAPCSHRQCH